MKTSRIDLIALNGATGEHYKYEEVADKILNTIPFFTGSSSSYYRNKLIKILVENFPDE